LQRIDPVSRRGRHVAAAFCCAAAQLSLAKDSSRPRSTPACSTNEDDMIDKIRDRQQRKEQYHALRQLEDWLEMPMFLLSLMWVILLTLELTRGIGPAPQTLATAIWVVFILEFVLRFVIAPHKLKYLRKNWLTVFALALPALRVLRLTRVLYILRVGRAVRGLTLARVLTAFNRGLRSLKKNMGRLGFGYILALTLLVAVLGAAGVYAFERREAGGSLATFGDAMWFTAMLLTTSGSDYWPKTGEGRVLCFLLALYAFAIFGYVTATIATLLIGQEKKAEKQPANAATIAALEREVRRLADLLNSPSRQNSQL
jgi:voltage-gated potassium channel